MTGPPAEAPGSGGQGTRDGRFYRGFCRKEQVRRCRQLDALTRGCSQCRVPAGRGPGEQLPECMSPDDEGVGRCVRGRCTRSLALCEWPSLQDERGPAVKASRIQETKPMMNIPSFLLALMPCLIVSSVNSSALFIHLRNKETLTPST